MNGTAFFPGGDGLWKPNPGDDPPFPLNAVPVLGSDFGEAVSYDAQFERNVDYRGEIDGATWRGLLKILDLARIQREELVCTNAWPRLLEGDGPVKGRVPGGQRPPQLFVAGRPRRAATSEQARTQRLMRLPELHMLALAG